MQCSIGVPLWVRKTHFTHHCTTSATRCSFPPSYSYVCGSRGPGGECERGAPGQPSVRSIAVPARRASLNWTAGRRSDEHTSELQSLMRNWFAVFCLQKNI